MITVLVTELYVCSLLVIVQKIQKPVMTRLPSILNDSNYYEYTVLYEGKNSLTTTSINGVSTNTFGQWLRRHLLSRFKQCSASTHKPGVRNTSDK